MHLRVINIHAGLPHVKILADDALAALFSTEAACETVWAKL